MSDSASRKTEVHHSKMAQSKVASNAEEHSIGDLSAIQSEIENPVSNPHTIGDMKNVDATSNSDVLGDITLLEEAFAEMEDSAENTDDEIPMLHSTIEEPTVNPLAEEQDVSHSIPVLDQQATEFLKNSMPAANSENIEVKPESEIAEMADIPTLDTNSTAESKALSEPSLDNESQHSEFSLSDMESLEDVSTAEKLETQTTQSSHSNFSLSDIDNPAEKATEAEMEPVVTTFDAVDDEDLEALVSSPIAETSTPEENVWANDTASSEPPAFSHSEPQASTKDTFSSTNEALKSQTDEASKTAFSTLAANFDSNTSIPEEHNGLTDSKMSDEVFTNDTIHSTIEEKIAKATGDTTSSGFHDIPLVNEHVSGLPETELAPGFVEDIAQSQFSTPVGELVPQSKESDSPTSEASMNMSIPFELHSQLSKKIDELVLDATMSLTNELEQQLSAQLESLLGNAVESVLPKLVDQMANELRSEVKGRVKQQLPIIVNDVLGKTRLS